MPAVESSAIREVDYHAVERILLVTYKDGDPYRYFEVPSRTYAELLAAESEGTFVNKEIKPHFKYVRLQRSS